MSELQGHDRIDLGGAGGAALLTDTERADRVAGFTAVGATLRATTDATMSAVRGLAGDGLGAAQARSLAELVDDVASQLPAPASDDRFRAPLGVAASTAGRLTELARRTAAVPRGAFAPLSRLGSTVADGYHLAVEAWVAAGPDGERESVVPTDLLDLPCELVRITAELDELAAGRTRTRAREVLAATDLLLGIGRDVGRLVRLRAGA